MYRFKAIILNITKIRDNNTRIVMISSEYGKITGWWNKKNISGIDLGDVVEVLISRENNKNTIKNVEIVSSGWNKEWDYIRILGFLETLHVINKITKDGDECGSLYADTLFFIEYGNKQTIQPHHYSIFQMRILKALGSMDPELIGDDVILRYIYQHISHTPLERILGSSNIKDNHIMKIQQINFHSIYMLEK